MGGNSQVLPVNGTQRNLMESQSAAGRPRSVGIAVTLLWASLFVGVVKVLMDFSYLRAVARADLISFVIIFTFALIVFLIFRISAGKNWARIAYLVLFVIGTLPTVPIVLGEFSRSPVAGVLSVVQVGLQIYALVLLFTKPGSGWFRKVASA